MPARMPLKADTRIEKGVNLVKISLISLLQKPCHYLQFS
ncbi:hypothetical protein KKC1_24040 [Calderihabitans maritimus]|uniref:Uncharacterized protein n=1 Tax=Calderihabitans maritimus TaxID=1246530 RepID=A0A1Z5HVA7_9FIRM|nr:hypothetical protein KKC1_24040 [Calderihabitans maritimus]